MGTQSASSTPTRPVPITHILPNYLVFDVDHADYLRRDHHITGVLIGSIPQAPSQNIFHGLPAQLMPEEARLLVEKGVAYIVDDVALHTPLLNGTLPEAERRAFAKVLERQGQSAASRAREKQQEKRRVGLAREAAKRNRLAQQQDTTEQDNVAASGSVAQAGDEVSLFDSAPASRGQTSDMAPTYHVTPATSYPPLQPPQPPKHAADVTSTLPVVPSSYPLFKLLHEKGYFMFPGLRFGCQYSAYPGDPLRYHSHFLAVGKEWNEEFDLLDLVGGGRLGTGVKKGFLYGGQEPGKGNHQEGDVRAFCVEWAGM